MSPTQLVLICNHLTCHNRALYAGLGICANPEEDDLADKNQKHALAWTPEDDPDIIEQEEISKKEGDLEESGVCSDTKVNHGDGDDDEWSESESEAEEEVTTVRGAAGLTGKGKKKKKKSLSICNKVSDNLLSLFPGVFLNPRSQIHSTVVHIFKSPKRRRKMRHLVRSLCEQKYKYLVPVKGM